MNIKSRIAALALLAPLAGCSSVVDGGEAAPLGTTKEAIVGDHYAYGFAWVNPPNPVYPDYSFNSGGATNTYTGSNGIYQVTMPELGVSGGTVQVVSYGGSPTRCKVQSWYPSGGAQIINVRCHDTNGLLASSPFVVFFNKGNDLAGGRLGHLYFSGSSVPAGYSYNSSGGTNSVTRTSLGHYNAFLPGLSFSNAGVHVTAYGSGPEFCNIVGWGDTEVSIRCNDKDGNPADSAFVLNYSETTPRPERVGGHAWVVGLSAPSDYQFEQPVYACGAVAPITVSGSTDVTYPNTRPTAWSQATMVLATAYGETGNFCKVQGWTWTSTGYVTHTACFTPSGAPISTPFTSSLMGDWAAPC
jgi:hypothetical protein